VGVVVHHGIGTDRENPIQPFIFVPDEIHSGSGSTAN
jgi:hypothetical protein